MAKTHKLEEMDPVHFYTLHEVCQRRCLESKFVIQCVDYGIAEVKGGGREEDWLFSLEAVPRLEKAFRLWRDLGIDFTGLAIVLDLLDDIEQLRGNIDNLNKRLQGWES